MSKTRIEWCDHTMNPVVGCTPCSEGCRNCYAARMAYRFSFHPNQKISERYAGLATADGWTGKIWFDYDCLSGPKTAYPEKKTTRKSRGRVFVGSMCDLFNKEAYPVIKDGDAYRFVLVNLFNYFVKNPQDTFMLLTKRPENMLVAFNTMLKDWHGLIGYRGDIPWPLPNLWLGVTVCNQTEADAKIPVLLQTPAAAKRFVSIEPMLGAVDLFTLTGEYHDVIPNNRRVFHRLIDGLDWVISGFETGHNARPGHPDWLRSLRDRCADAGVPYLHKSNGEWREAASSERDRYCSIIDCYRSARPEQRPEGSDAAFIKQFCQVALADGSPAARLMRRVGKAKTGRLIDGVEYNQFPGE